MHASDLHISLISTLPEKQRQTALESLTDEEAEALLYDWRFWAREKQLPPAGDWRIWLIKAGRGFGKTRTGAETVRAQVESGAWRRVALIGRTAADVRDVMVEGESGILAVSPSWNRPRYEPSKRRLTWPNGAVATTYSADKPDLLRGPQHDGGWCDELAAWRYPETWDMFLMGLRLGQDPRTIVTTTPKPVPHMKALYDDPTVVITSGSSYENRANLASAFFETIIARYEGTRLGQQEIYAEDMDDVPGALWNRPLLEDTRVKKHPELVRVVIALDPAVSTSETASETGIVVAGLGDNGEGYVLEDLTLSASPKGWGDQSVAGYYKYRADRMIGEVNNGGDMIEHTIRMIDPKVSFKQVRATRGKQTRAEPVAALYEQDKVHHVGLFAELEDQLCGWVPGDGKSPDRLDALVWALTELMLGPQAGEITEQPESASKFADMADDYDADSGRWNNF